MRTSPESRWNPANGFASPASFAICPDCIRSYPVDPRIQNNSRRRPSNTAGCPHCRERQHGATRRPQRHQPPMHIEQTQRIRVAPVAAEIQARETTSSRRAEPKHALNMRAMAVGAGVSLALIVPAAWLWLL